MGSGACTYNKPRIDSWDIWYTWDVGKDRQTLLYSWASSDMGCKTEAVITA